MPLNGVKAGRGGEAWMRLGRLGRRLVREMKKPIAFSWKGRERKRER